MNFLSHYYHEYPNNDPYYICGCILPDILSNYSKQYQERLKLHPAKLISSSNKQISNITKGVQQHYFVDAYFHDSEFFNENTNYINELIRNQNLDCFTRRLYAFGHVFLEIMLDRIILLQKNEVGQQFYDLLNKVDLNILRTFITNNNTDNTQPKVAEHFDEFRKYQFIYNYIDNQRLIPILNRINQGLGNSEITAFHIQQLNKIISDTEQTLFQQKFPKFPS